MLYAKIGMCDVERAKGNEDLERLPSVILIVLIYLVAGTAEDRDEMRLGRNTEENK